jgi:hypothetical protein
MVGFCDSFYNAVDGYDYTTSNDRLTDETGLNFGAKRYGPGNTPTRIARVRTQIRTQHLPNRNLENDN